MPHYFTLLIYAFAIIFGLLEDRHLNQSHTPDDSNPSLLSNDYVYSGETTYYDPGLSVCSISSGDNELVCGIADSFYDTQTINGALINNKFYDRQISVTGPTDTVIITIGNRCSSCKDDDLDLSRPAFNQIGDPINGHVSINWRSI
ncbi:unnamed protein product [Rotaria sordida]|uniref:RlpA-like protein double-psi beta-barrel domain-containing protein n=1 Tax=Rotaria sordida TaxID=392033 RepID=A0A815IP08_9BILA|nr:unnamed protein product [Rotaria sordida]CAF1111991.1 unnamed protein product [Rotaria sordida]CAF1368875.1 unnamed protein product [Rotaria sordida]CAF3948057.1 unnamed protein product [Rotaria sordida]